MKFISFEYKSRRRFISLRELKEITFYEDSVTIETEKQNYEIVYHEGTEKDIEILIFLDFLNNPGVSHTLIG